MANAIFSCVSAVAFLVFHRAIASFIGLEQPLVLLVVGTSLLIFAGGLFRNATREKPNPREALIAVSLDFAWVLGSVFVLLLNVLSREGNWAVGMIADVVLVFAILQWVGLRRMWTANTRLAQSQ
ncbi:hypothetical protein [Haloferula sp.]|uniref:hypothetical protein n=1 Tax=Haloferula sp. TaxID=2497595 RepID=UPI00329C17D7